MNRINNYDELVQERKKIEAEIHVHKAVLHERFMELKVAVEPFFYLIPVLNAYKGRAPRNSTINFLTSLGIDLFVGQKLLSKANWFTRLTVPMLLKGISSMVLGAPKAKQHHAEPINSTEIQPMHRI